MKKNSHIGWIVWSLAIAFYLYEYLLRVFPSAATKAIMQAFDLQASSFAVMVAYYLYAYAPMQLVSGLLIDRFGARIWLTISCILCATGCLLFAESTHFYAGAFARFLMGMGSACAFVGVIYLSSHWFSLRLLPFLIGLANSFGMLGAALGEGPISYLSGKYGFDEINIVFAITGFVLAIFIFFIVRNDPKKEGAPHENHRLTIKETFQKAISNKKLWINACAALFFYLPTIGFGALWAAPFVRGVYHTSEHLGALASSMFYFGWIFGGPIFGRIAVKSKDKCRDVALTPLGALIALIALIYFPVQNLVWPFVWLFIAGCFCSAELIHYALSIEFSSKEIKATASALTNFLVFAGGALVQTVVGLELDLLWKGEMVEGLRAYSPFAYQISMSIFPIALVFASLISWFGLRTKRSV